MLTASQIDALRDASGQLLDPVTNFLIEDIAKRVAEAGQLTSTAAYGVWTAQRLGMSQKKLEKALQEKLNVSKEELEKLLTQSAEVGYNFDLSRLHTTQGIPFAANSSIQQIVNAAVKQANKDLTNITRTMGFVGSDGKPRELTKAYKKACDDAFMRTVTGAQDATSAIRDALKGLADKGIVTIDHHSHRHFTVEAAVRQNIMGGMGLMQEQISEQNHDDLGCDGFEISAHAASAADHEPFQGRQYTDKEYKALNNSLVRRIGTLNCAHAAFPIILGISEPQYTEEELEDFRQQNEKGVTIDGRHYTTYEATQRQRQLERAIRGQKRKILIDKTVDDPDKLQADQIKLVRLRDEYARFSKEAGLPTQHARAEAAGFTWKEGKAAEREARSHSNNSLSSGLLNSRKTKNQVSGNITATTESAIWDDSIGTQAWSDEARRNFHGIEQGLTRRKTEEGILFGADGKVILQKSGDKDHVTFTAKETSKMHGGVLTHNHPDGSSFSFYDINMLRHGELAELRAATQEGVYRIQAPKKWRKEISTLEKIEKVYYDIDAEISPGYYDRFYAGEISRWDAELLGQQATIEELCKRYGIPYKFEKWSMFE